MSYDTVVLDGDLSLIIVGSAEAILEIEEDGEFGAYTKIAGDDVYIGDYVVTPKAFSETVLETKDKIMTDNVRVLEIPYFETGNLFNGKTVYIANEV